MSGVPTMKDEYWMLVSELRQNRQIQLQAFFSTPIWLSLFFGFISSKGGEGVIERIPYIVLVPIPLILMSLLLIVNRRRSSNVIIAYFRTAFDQRLVDKPGWNYRLPKFRRILKNIKTPADKAFQTPQRFDFNVIVWLSYFIMSLICYGFYWLITPQHEIVFWIFLTITVLVFVAVFYWIVRLSNIKPELIKAWEETLSSERQNTYTQVDKS